MLPRCARARQARTAAIASALLCATALTASADPFFDRVATFMVRDNLAPEQAADKEKEAVAEIISATPDGMTLVYTDAGGKRVGMIDLADPGKPKPLGTVDVGGEPTSVKIVADVAFVAVDTTDKKFKEPTGKLVAIDLATRAVAKECALPGQPDSVAASKDGGFLAIAMENQRDEETNDGNLPQLPAGSLVTVALQGNALDCGAIKEIAMTGPASVAGEDPEPEFVDINGRGEIVVTLQENNAVAIVDGKTGTVKAHFDAGTVSLDRIDTEKDGRIDFTGSMKESPREPDGVAWLDDERFATANEGDWKGGTRGFTIFKRDGTIAYDSGNSLEHAIVAVGHYPEKRNKKGVEIEGVAVGTFGGDRLIFVGAERGSVVAVYRDTNAAPEFLQVLPSGIGPEGLLAIPSRNLFVTANETDLTADGGIGGQVVVYQRAERPAPAYPTIRSANGANGLPIAWGALSGLAADPNTPATLYAVTDSIYGTAPRVLTIDASQTPAVITAEMTVTRNGKPAENLDLEGIAVAQGGGFWLASEGNAKDRKNTLLRVDASGAVTKEVELPAEVESTATNAGFEGVAVSGSGTDETVWLSQQRPWKGDAENEVKLFAFKPASGKWGAVRYPLEPKGEGWIGLSEIALVGNRAVVIERDNLAGATAKVKRLYALPLADLQPAPLGAQAPLVSKALLHDLLPDLQAPRGYVLDKVEGFAVDSAGQAFAVTDNDGVDGASGETQFLRLGAL